MTVSIILLAAGALFLVGTVLLLCLKKLPLRWGVSLILCGLILCGAGWSGIRAEMDRRTEDYGCVYMALRYLEDGQAEPAALYLQRSELRNDYHLLAAQVLLEQIRGNDSMAKVRLNILQNSGKLTLDQEDGVASLRTWSPEKERSLQRTVEMLVEMLPLQEKEQEALDRKFELESGKNTGDWEEAGIGEAEQLRFRINQAVGAQDWKKALEDAIELVHLSPRADDRLLLASVVAELTYSDMEMETHQFAAYGDKSKGDTKEEEEETLTREYERLQRKLEVLQLDLADAGEEEAPELIAQEKELSRQVEEAEMQANNIFAYRALNSIVDIHTLEAQIVRAKLYFAIHSCQQAIDLLCETADSVQAKLSGNRRVVESLRTLQEVYASGNAIGTDSDDFRSEMQMLMGSVHPELINFSLSPLSQAFAQQVADDQKTYSDGLYVMGLDMSEYPQIRVQLGGQESVIERIAEQKNISANDTRAPLPTYQVSYKEGMASMSSICFVVDVSGSMSGAPLQNAKEALHTFLDNTDGYTEMALVSFESAATTRVPLTTSTGQIETGVDNLWDGGGTEITAGIREGTQALLNARGSRSMILMTDGQSSVDMSVVQEAVDQNIVIFTIGFGSVNDEILTQIADMTGGQYLRAESSEELISVYNSLRRVIGNTVTITYTAADSGETNRYFYIQDGKSGLSAREEYALEDPAAEQAAELTPVSVDYEPIMETRERLDSLLENQQDMLYTYLRGSGLDQVTSVSIGGLACGINSQSSSSLQLGIPCRLASGSYDLTLVTGDGTSVVVPKLLWIGDRVSYRTYLAGDLEITASQGLLMPDQSLALGQTVKLTDRLEDETMPHTLSVELKGVLAFPAVTLPPQTGDSYDTQLMLGVEGSAAGHGVLYVNYGDGAYDRYADPTICSGEMTLRYSGEESLILPSEVSAS